MENIYIYIYIYIYISLSFFFFFLTNNGGPTVSELDFVSRGTCHGLVFLH